MNKHTKGPWKAEATAIEFVDNKMIGIFQVELPAKEMAFPEMQANATLITQAPDMYEILERMTYEIAAQGGVKAETFTEVLALLRKARGEK